MRSPLSICIAAALISTLTLVLFNELLTRVWQQNELTSHLTSHLHDSFKHGVSHYIPSLTGGTDHSKGTIVMGTTARANDNVTEVTSELRDWRSFIYTADVSPSAYANDPDIHTTPANKGHESMAYLSYIIDHYDSLPSIIAFLHPHNHAWHTGGADLDNVDALNALNLSYVEEVGYVNLRCEWESGCQFKERSKNNTDHVTPEVWVEVFAGTSTPHEDIPRPDEIAQTCCAQFVVSRATVLMRPRNDYVRMRDWVLITALNDIESGQVMEFLWHIIFQQDVVTCPDPDVCRCRLYGKCGGDESPALGR